MNNVGHILSLFNGMASMGAPLIGEEYSEVHGMNIIVIEFTVSNKSRLPETLPFGVSAVIRNERNTKLSWVRVQAHPNFGLVDSGGTPLPIVFNDVEVTSSNYSEEICKARVVRTVVPLDTEVDGYYGEGNVHTGVWASTVTPIDTSHALKETVYVVTVNDEVGEEWDNTLGIYVKVNRKLQQKPFAGLPASSTAVDGTVVTYKYYQNVNCGWMSEVSDVWDTAGIGSYTTVVDYGWPPVLSSVNILSWRTKRKDLRYYPNFVWLREAYNGACKATVARVWSVTAPTVAKPAAIHVTNISYNCPFFSFSTGPCVHGEIEVAANILSGDSEWDTNALSAIVFPATATPADWPETLVIDDDVVPYRGGFFRRTVTLDRPV
jgi:hypothetical protein